MLNLSDKFSRPVSKKYKPGNPLARLGKIQSIPCGIYVENVYFDLFHRSVYAGSGDSLV